MPTPTTAPEPAQACLAAGAAAQEVLAQLRQAVPAISALDATALRQIVERLEPLQADLERSLAGCRTGSPTTPGGPTG